MSSENALDLQYVHDSFQKSLKDDDDVIVDPYIEGYNELVKFLNLIGSVFSFVSSDVKSKIKIMEKHRAGEDSLYYESFKKMMKYEKETNLHEKNGFTSGSRTMLRLHRGLDFIRLFLKRLSELDDGVNTCTTCQNSYNETLAEFHPWYIRKAATLAMHALPSRPDLLKKVYMITTGTDGLTCSPRHGGETHKDCTNTQITANTCIANTFVLAIQVFGSEDKLSEAMEILPQTLQSCDEVYKRVEQLYSDFDFHGLP